MADKIDSRALYNRIAGCLLGGALGDALGYEVEFDSWEEIRRRFGENGIQKPFLHDDRAVFSDDTQMTLFTLEGMVLGYWRAEYKGIGAPWEVYIWQAYLSWLKSQGITPKNSIYKFDEVSDLLGGSWTGDEALAIAVYSCLKYPYQPEKALICAANHSGDSDSTAAIAGNILGAYLGLDALNMRWIYQLELRHLIMDQACRAVEIILYRESRLTEEWGFVKARTYDFMTKNEALMFMLAGDRQLSERCASYRIETDDGSDALINYLFGDFYKDLCLLRMDRYLMGCTGYYRHYEPDAAADIQRLYPLVNALLQMADGGYRGELIFTAIRSFRVCSMIRNFLQETYIDTASIRKHAPAPAAAEGPDPVLPKV